VIDGSALWIAEKQHYGKILIHEMLRSVLTIGICGISWNHLESVGHRKERSERHNRIGKEKPTSEFIS
jgi:hypothetical protein